MKNRHWMRMLALLLAAVLTLGLCGCSMPPQPPAATQAPDPVEPADQTSPEPAAEPAVEPAEGPVAEETAEPVEEPAEAPVEEPAPEEIPDDGSWETLVDEDGDGIILYVFNYKGSTVHALIVLDPSRVFVGTALPEPNAYGQGITLDMMLEQYGAVAGINAGGFKDEKGIGDGWPPSGITISRGIVFEGEEYGPIVGLDDKDQMWTGHYDLNDCKNVSIRDTVSFGPWLVSEGVKADAAQMETGIGARSAIGQRADGSVVLVTIDGRQGYSIGVTFADCIDIMADKLGCVDAANLDGGNSTCMMYNGEMIGRSANKAGGTRYLPDAWLVEALPEDYVRPEGVPDQVRLPANALGEQREYVGECTDEQKERMYTFAWIFSRAYYAYFGSSNSDRYYPEFVAFTKPESELRYRAELALMDRLWVNTWKTEPDNIVVDGAYVNPDGSYDILITLDVTEYSGYWTYVAKGIHLRITVVDDPVGPVGLRAIATN
ncbi:MAG: phosphodiester glycosidase family protein [Oscillospiraceae bacterium]|nr:phosphodiester glycosidase family protein [Oscillospiraceae bacterium]